ncbi:DUF2339 domain-containing protein [Arsukibacterium sp.]|uniref:DUF2339 domain-containing protein n=1 Tax=Arsukibacterium sp. TaxID=1977258 RepID=UPI00299CF582|nr:DUF2339 domain-containing protein [Arsukibacterium sp.]MDX1677492.1 DUF2339 domain-containing protein [Arsukibacterium sp.]
MEWVLFIILIGIFVIAGAIQSFRNQSKITDMLREVQLLRQQVNVQSNQITRISRLITDNKHVAPDSRLSTESADEQQVSPSASNSVSQSYDSNELPAVTPAPKQSEAPSTVAAYDRELAKTQQKPPLAEFNFEAFIKANGLLWLGGIVLAIGGIFLARYSIEAGLLPPAVRLMIGGVFGVFLVVAAEFLSRHRARFNIYSPYVCASLASGGVITCYAIVMVAFDYYAFISPQLAFALLAAVSLSSTALSIRFGPLLAWIGVIGAYIVPALVSTGSNNVGALLLYTAFVSVSAVWISHTVSQVWLWRLSFIGHFLWLAVSLSIANSSHFWMIITFTLFSIYLYVLTDIVGWRLRSRLSSALSMKQLLMPRKEQLGVIIPLLALAIFLSVDGNTYQVVMTCLVISAALCSVPVRHSALDSWPFMVLAFVLYAYTLMPAPASYQDSLFPFTNGYLFIQIASLMAVSYSVLMLHLSQRPAYLLLMIVAPISLFGISYAMSPDAASQYLYPVFAVELALVALVSSVVAFCTRSAVYRVTLTILANAAITLCLTMLLDAAMLTLTIAIQIASMSYLSRKYAVELPVWLYKAALIVVTARLSFAPWLADYAQEQIFSMHWTAIIYPAVLAILWFSRHYNASPSVKTWLEGAFVHVCALLVTTETSYLLVGHYPNFFDLSFKEAALLAFNWLLLAAVYVWRAQHVGSATKLYQAFAALLVVGFALLHMDISFVSNPFVERVHTGDGLLLNWLLILWALPMVVIGVLHQRSLVPARLNIPSKVVLGFFAVFYINGLIRNIYQDGQLLLDGTMPQSELYTYSIVWLLIATVMVFLGQYLRRAKVSNLGFAILAVVILKAFWVDMANLEGLYRAISFIGLGLSLVGIGWLYQKLNFERLAVSEN